MTDGFFFSTPHRVWCDIHKPRGSNLRGMFSPTMRKICGVHYISMWLQFHNSTSSLGEILRRLTTALSVFLLSGVGIPICNSNTRCSVIKKDRKGFQIFSAKQCFAFFSTYCRFHSPLFYLIHSWERHTQWMGVTSSQSDVFQLRLYNSPSLTSGTFELLLFLFFLWKI